MVDIKIKGGCLCGAVSYEISRDFKVFQYCHCSRCQKVTGSAFASNIYISASGLQWLQGQESITRYEIPDSKYFANCFCAKCGANLPWQAKGVDTVIVPAGSLDEPIEQKPVQSIHWDSHSCWYENPDNLKKWGALPVKRKPNKAEGASD